MISAVIWRIFQRHAAWSKPIIKGQKKKDPASWCEVLYLLFCRYDGVRQLAWRRRNAGISRSSPAVSSDGFGFGSARCVMASARGRSRIDGVLSTGADVSTAGSRRSVSASTCDLLVHRPEILLIRLVRPTFVAGTDSASGSGAGAGGTKASRRAVATSAGLSPTIDAVAGLLKGASGALIAAGAASDVLADAPRLVARLAAARSRVMASSSDICLSSVVASVVASLLFADPSGAAVGLSENIGIAASAGAGVRGAGLPVDRKARREVFFVAINPDS